MPKYSLEKNNTNSVFVSGFVLFTNGVSGGIRPTSLSAVSVVKRNATLFRLPETVDVQRIPSGKATNKKKA